MSDVSALQVGDLIAPNEKKPEWGMGKIIHLREDLASVFYRNQPTPETKRFRTSALRKADEQSEPRLDHLPEFEPRDGGIFRVAKDFVSFDGAKTRFLDKYPQGFKDPQYIGTLKTGERAFKQAAHDLYEETIGGGKGQELLAAGNIRELVKRTKAVVAIASKLLAKVEIVAFTEGLADDEAAKRFFTAFFELGETPSQETFEPYAEAVAALPAQGATHTDRWTIATLLPYIAYPSTYMFVKPVNLQKAATRLGFDIGYDPKPNWATYAAVLEMSSLYQDEMKSLKPRDLMDVQSFFWVTCEPVSKAKTAAV